MIDTTCFNCGDELPCRCGDSLTFETENGPVCPFCGSLNSAADAPRLYDDGTTETNCDSCGQLFFVDVSISHTWSATRPDQQGENA